jgi:hypothetical protein
VAQILEAWVGIVGPALADVTTPRRLSQGTLTIGCTGPVAMELQHLTTEVLVRISQYLGSNSIRRLRFVQITTVRAPAMVKRRPTEAAEIAASQAVSRLADGPLRAALAKLGRAVLSESASRLQLQLHTKR